MDKPKRVESIYQASSPPPRPEQKVTFEAPPQPAPITDANHPAGGYAPCNYRPVLTNYTGNSHFLGLICLTSCRA